MHRHARSLCLAGLAGGLFLGGCSEDEGPKRGLPEGGASSDGGAADGDAAAQGDGGSTEAPRCKRYSKTREPFFGDLHVHTALSLDANLQGTRLRPVEAHRFARGEEVGVQPYDAQDRPLRSLKLARPLDFVAVSDHAEFLGLVTTCITPGLPGYDSPQCKQYREDPDSSFITLNSRLAASQDSAGYAEPCTSENDFCNAAAVTAWQEVQDAANGANDESDACAFTAFVAYEWSASPGLKNLHRNVIFRGSDVPPLPFSYFEGSQEEELWDALEQGCLDGVAGCDVLTIPHNSNLSAGLMFEGLNAAGHPIDADYARRRASFEPLVEVFQHKGSSECLPEMGPDELCNFEKMPFNTLGSVTFGVLPDQLVPGDYVRDALAQGLRYQAELGVNPFAYGMVASTDTHMGTPGATEEKSFLGHGGAGSNTRDSLPPGLVDKIWLNPGGLAVLWAEENSRAALFAAMRRKEAYATSGTRIVLRFFGGATLPDDLCQADDFAERGYTQGVPMGGELPESSEAPRFAVWALRDPGTDSDPGVPLQRVQIIKGWLEGEQLRYAVYDVAGGANEASADPDSCELSGEGHDELCSTWQDPDFDPNQHAFYYARVLENPSCRWHAHACRAANVTCGPLGASNPDFAGCCDATYPKVHQERAWSSPIFHRAR